MLPNFYRLQCQSVWFVCCLVAGDNLFIGSQGQLKLGDFGHAQYMVDGVYYSDMEGTVHYMAPEVSTHCTAVVLIPLSFIVVIWLYVRIMGK